MPASRSSSTSCQRFSFRQPGTLVWASSSTSATSGLAGEDRVEVHLLEARCRGSRRCRRGTTSRSPICAAVLLRPCVSTNPTTTSVPRVRAPVALVEHGEGLADAGRGAEVDAEPPAGHGASLRTQRAAVERQVELEHVHAWLAEEAERPAVGVRRRSARSTSSSARPRARRPAAPGAGRWPPRCAGSRPEPEAVTASTGTGHVGASPFSLPVGGDPLPRPLRAASGLVGPRFEPR